jgi:hypothetical protein
MCMGRSIAEVVTWEFWYVLGTGTPEIIDEYYITRTRTGVFHGDQFSLDPADQSFDRANEEQQQ